MPANWSSCFRLPRFRFGGPVATTSTAAGRPKVARQSGTVSPRKTLAGLGLLLMAAGIVLAVVPAGCGRVNYPEPKVTTPVGRPGQCAQCEKRIASVGKEHLVEINGVQYVVCDQNCADRLREWLRQLDER